MKPAVKLAMKSVGIFVDKNTFYNEEIVRDSLASTPKDEIQQKTKHFITLLKNLPQSAIRPALYDDIDEDKFFHDSINNIIYNEEMEVLNIRMEGFKKNVQQDFFKSLQEVFKKVEPLGEKETMIHLDYIRIPDDFSRTKFEDCDVAMRTRSETTFEIEFSGSFVILILVYYWRRAIQLFFMKKKIATNSSLKNNTPLNSSISSEDEKRQSLSEESLPEVELRHIPFSSMPADVPFSSTPADPHVNESVPSSSSVAVEEICVDCALVQSSINIPNMTKSSISLVGNVSSCSTLCLEHDDSWLTFTEAFCQQITTNNFLTCSNIQNLKNNLNDFFCKVLDLIPNGRLRFYCKILENMTVVCLDDQDRIVTLLNELANIIVEIDNEDFEEEFSGSFGKSARKSLFRYMSETSNFLSLQAVIETFVIFHRKKINISTFLPEELKFLTNSVSNLPKDGMSIKYHHALSNMTREVIVHVMKEKALEVHELVKEEFMNDIIPAGRDLYLYFNKKENILCHLVVFSLKKVYLERIKLDCVKFEEENLSLVTHQWRFFLKSKISWQKLLNMKNKLREISEAQLDVSLGDFEEVNQSLAMKDNDSSEGSAIDDRLGKNPDINSELINSPHRNKSPADDLSDNIPAEGICDDDLADDLADDDLADDGSDNGQDNSDEEDTLYGIAESGFSVKKEDIMEYFDPGRSFYRHATGRDWPMMYGCPCAVVVGYDRVRVPNTRKRNAYFARLTGRCTICHSTHRYAIKESPFKESINSAGFIEYEPVKDMNVSVFAEGRFYLVDDCKPDITKPLHLKQNAKGLDLRGEERQLVGMKASMEGAAPVYREQMAYLQREQILSSNRTSVRSLPVIR
jgi:hypothetical protein